MRRGADRSSVLPRSRRQKKILFFVSSAAWQSIAGTPIVDVDHVSAHVGAHGKARCEV